MKTYTTLYDSDDYYIKDEDGNIIDYNYDIQQLVLMDILKTYNKPLLLIYSNLGLLNANKKTTLAAFSNLSEFISNLKDTNTLIIDREGNTLIVKNIHHDGTNYYKLIPIEKATNKQLIELIDGHKSLIRLRKDELIELVIDYIL